MLSRVPWFHRKPVPHLKAGNFMSNALTDVETRVSAIITELRSKADELEQQHLPVIHDAAEILERFSQDKITAELMQLGKDVLPGSTVDAIVAIIQDAGEAAAKLAAATAPPAEPAEPEPPAGPADPSA